MKAIVLIIIVALVSCSKAEVAHTNETKQVYIKVQAVSTDSTITESPIVIVR